MKVSIEAYIDEADAPLAPRVSRIANAQHAVEDSDLESDAEEGQKQTRDTSEFILD